jgi:uncharacterized protein (DUF1501 family)
MSSHDHTQAAPDLGAPSPDLCTGCTEYHTLSRRSFMQVGAAGGAAAAVMAAAPAWLPRVAFAGETPGSDFRDVLVSVYLRGGCDGLSMCVPFNDPVYVLPTCRPTLRVYAPDDTTQAAGRRALHLNNASTTNGSTVYDFGLHPAMSALLPAYNEGKLLIVQGSGLTNTNKSHFDAQRWMESGEARNNNLFTGWLGRHLATKPPVNPNTALRAIGVADGLQRTLVGSPLALPIPNFSSNPGNPPALNNIAAVSATNTNGYGLTGTSSTNALRRGVLDQMYDTGSVDPLRNAANNTLNTIDRLNAIGASGYTPAGGAVYPSNSFGYSLRTTAALIAANSSASDGQFVEAVAIDLGSWDTHASQYTYNATTGVFTGSMVNLMNTLSQGLAAFYADVIKTRGLRVTVSIVSEFGRRVGENGTVGTDHGLGNVMMLMGTAVIGGRVLTVWPGLPNGQFTNLDTPLTTDIRHILAEVIDKRLNNSAGLSTIFPGFAPTYRNVIA